MAIRRTVNSAPLSVGRYEISGKVGNGAIGVHYRARDVASDTLVSVQIFDPDHIKYPGLAEQLRCDFKSATQLEHLNILRILDFGLDGDNCYLVTEWVEGITLAAMIEAHLRLPEETALRIITQVGQAVDYAHSQNRCPQRVSPSNILVRTDGMAKLVAFEPGGSTEELPTPGDPMKTTSPASVRKPTNMSFAQTIHSLGVTLFETVTGRPWIDPAAVPPAPPGSRGRSRPSRRRILVGLSERVEAAIARATDPDPGRRPGSCAEWIKLLRSKPRSAVTARPDVRTTPDTDDRRAFVRYAVGVGSSCTINSSLFDTPETAPLEPSAVWPLIVRDISSGGIGILLARRCEPGTELAIELVSESTRVARTLGVRVVRVRRDTLGHWVLGCEFLTPLSPDELLSVLGHLGRVDPT